MTLNPLIPHVPAFLSFLIYGWVMGAVFRFGRRGGYGCLVGIFLWYGFALASVFFFGLLSVQDRINQGFFALGFLAPYARTLWESDSVQEPLAVLRSMVAFVQRTSLRAWDIWQDFQAERRGRTKASSAENNDTKPNNSPGDNTNPHSDDEAIRREQRERERQARARREQAERESQERARKTESPRQEAPRPRTPEEILGLKKPWTQEDLRAAYKREAGRTHPDKWIGKPESIRQAMEAEYKAIQEAYRILNTSES